MNATNRAAALALILALSATGLAVAPAPARADDAAQSTAKFSVDTPIDVLMADARAKAVVDKYIPDLDKSEHYPLFHAESLRQIAPNAGGRLSDDVLKQIDADLAKIS